MALKKGTSEFFKKIGNNRFPTVQNLMNLISIRKGKE